MITTLLTTLIFVLSAGGLALGVMLKRRPLEGSCGNCARCVCRKDRS